VEVIFCFSEREPAPPAGERDRLHPHHPRVEVDRALDVERRDDDVVDPVESAWKVQLRYDFRT
jgi:hypothetical protein